MIDRDEYKRKAQSRDCSCVNGEDRDSNFNEVIDEICDEIETRKEKYELSKMSRPGFTLTSDHISVITEILDNGVCDDCKAGENPIKEMSFYNELITKRNSLYTKHKGFITIKKDGQPELDAINRMLCNELLGTSCGAEYWFNMGAGDGNEEYFALLGKDIKKFKKEKNG